MILPSKIYLRGLYMYLQLELLLCPFKITRHMPRGSNLARRR